MSIKGTLKQQKHIVFCLQVCSNQTQTFTAPSCSFLNFSNGLIRVSVTLNAQRTRVITKEQRIRFPKRKKVVFHFRLPPHPEIKSTTYLTALSHPANATIKSLLNLFTHKISINIFREEAVRQTASEMCNPAQHSSFQGEIARGLSVNSEGVCQIHEQNASVGGFFFSPPPPQKFKSQLHSIISYQTTLCKELGLWLQVQIHSVCLSLLKIPHQNARSISEAESLELTSPRVPGVLANSTAGGDWHDRSHTPAATTTTLILTRTCLGLFIFRQNLQQTLLQIKGTVYLRRIHLTSRGW